MSSQRPQCVTIDKRIANKVITHRGGHTDGAFAATLLKKYRRYFIRYIFEKVPTVPVLGTVIRYFSKEKFCSFWKQYF